ncbi:MAG: aminotransferase class V-fold PLP-dependent enzyme, partial [Clostridia bacterium]|nr:aminotransferase class V-fold PLP-dependent enzyme [Clostridia bacterium]
MIYLDNAATTQIRPEVLDAMMPFLKDSYGNAGAVYDLGRKAAEAVATAREQVAYLVGCSPTQIVFTSGGSEANNLAVFGLRRHLLRTGKTHIITSAVEHDSMLKAVKELCSPLNLDG